jgi:ubiquinone/menaquinone biosynthesis C-methylase UbiE
VISASSRRLSARRLKWALLPLIVVGAAAALYGVGVCRDANPEPEVARLAEVLELRPGRMVAEIGAGKGRMTAAMARYLGPTGHVFSTELNAEKLDHIRTALARAGLENVTVIRAGTRETKLPPDCCDAIFMKKVYHHFTHPSDINADLFRALRPGGLLAVIDFAPRFWRFWLRRPRGVPANRGGHGMPKQILVEELTDAGFQIERVIDAWWSWPEKRYCVVVRRPPATRAATMLPGLRRAGQASSSPF